MISVKRYRPEDKAIWNEFVLRSKNGTFLFDRNYMDYHADRFDDHSLLFFSGNELVALLPANQSGTTLFSHQGLTYGGLIMGYECTATVVCEIFAQIKKFLVKEKFTTLVYKCIPHIYHSYPAEEDLYALYKTFSKPKLISRSISSTIKLSAPLSWQRLRRRSLRKAQEAGITVEETSDLESLWKIMENNLLDKYGVKPVHSLEEMKLLQSRFPLNIRCFAAMKDGKMLAGSVVYSTKTCAHAQYTHASPQGKSLGANDILYRHIFDTYKTTEWFDFGISCENNGLTLNENLIFQKEGFGGRGICYDIYELDLND